MSYRPRGTLARAVFEKFHNDTYLEEYDTRQGIPCCNRAFHGPIIKLLKVKHWPLLQWKNKTRHKQTFLIGICTLFVADTKFCLEPLRIILVNFLYLYALQWYLLSHELPHEYQSKFLPLGHNGPDETTLKWLEETKLLSTNIWLHLWHAIARTFLQFFMTQTDINGFLKRGSMFILSEQQFSNLLLSGGFDPNRTNEIDVLDIGAGDGEISTRLVNSLLNMRKDLTVHVYATESSWTMRERLKKKNFTVVERIDDVANVKLISCLNVLDRCYDPFEILEDMYKALAPDGRIVIALVLPYTHYVEFNSSHLPLRPLMQHWPGKAKQFSFEAEATIFFEILERLGFKIESWTKAPYLCEGDLRQSFYWLIDLVVVVSKKPLK